MSPIAQQERAAPPSVLMAIAPIMAAVFVGFLIIGIAMPVLPLHVHQTLGLGTFVVGLVAGSQFGASLLSRFWAGRFADTRGGKRAVVVGLAGAAVSGALYALSLRFIAEPTVSVAILLAGRGLLGAAESFIITGALSWGLALVNAKNTGKVIAWIGSAMFASFAIGAPIGTTLYGAFDFKAIALATMLIPLATLLLVLPQQASPPTATARSSFVKVLRSVWVPGLGLALSSFGFGAVTTFVTLLFSANGWGPAWQPFTAFAIVFIAARAFLGHLPDKVGGAKIALASILVEATGQVLIWLAPGVVVALVGAGLTGLGYALVYPAFGIEAVRRAPPESRGLAMGAYTACLDLALGIASPALGLIAGVTGLRSVFMISAGVVLSGAAIALRMLMSKK
jgi:MFS family permease